jgi:hypothetical protein
VTSSPTGIPLVEPVKVSHGKATLHVTGGFKLDLDLPLGRNGVYQPNPGSFSLSFVARDGNGLLVGGSTPLGSAKTSSDLTLSFVLQGKHAYAFPSAEGECTIDVTHAGPKSFSATFSCKPLKAEGKTITARGTFEASA